MRLSWVKYLPFLIIKNSSHPKTTVLSICLIFDGQTVLFVRDAVVQRITWFTNARNFNVYNAVIKHRWLQAPYFINCVNHYKFCFWLFTLLRHRKKAYQLHNLAENSVLIVIKQLGCLRKKFEKQWHLPVHFSSPAEWK